MSAVPPAPTSPRTAEFVPLDPRKPTSFLNYRGDVTKAIATQIEEHRSFGLNTMMESLWPLSAEYDPKMNMTRVGCTFIAPPVPA